jgi:hypothetical protein
MAASSRPPVPSPPPGRAPAPRPRERTGRRGRGAPGGGGPPARGCSPASGGRVRAGLHDGRGDRRGAQEEGVDEIDEVAQIHPGGIGLPPVARVRGIEAEGRPDVTEEPAPEHDRVGDRHLAVGVDVAPDERRPVGRRRGAVPRRHGQVPRPSPDRQLVPEAVRGAERVGLVGVHEAELDHGPRGSARGDHPPDLEDEPELPGGDGIDVLRRLVKVVRPDRDEPDRLSVDEGPEGTINPGLQAPGRCPMSSDANLPRIGFHCSPQAPAQPITCAHSVPIAARITGRILRNRGRAFPSGRDRNRERGRSEGHRRGRGG